MTWEQQLEQHRRETARLKKKAREARNLAFTAVGLPASNPVVNGRRMSPAEVAAFKKSIGFREPHGYRLGQQLERR